MFITVLRWALLATALLGAPLAAQEAPAPTIAVEADGGDDARIAQRIRGILGEIDGLAGVRVTVNSGVVTLGGEVLDAASIDQAAGFATRVEGVVSVRNAITLNDDVSAQISPALERLQDRLIRTLSLAPLVLVGLLVLALVAGLGVLLTRGRQPWDRLAPNPFIADLYRLTARIAFVLVGVVMALDVLNATALIGAVLGAAGVAGLAVGFAVRDTVENFIASVLLSLRQPFRPNDFVEIEGELGSVARLTSRATILISPDGNSVRIPNATVFKGKIVNYTRQPQRRFTFDLGVDADSDLGLALSTAVAAMERLDFVLPDPGISAWVAEVGDSNVVLSFAGWLDQNETDWFKGRGEAIRVAKVALEGAGFGLPEPIYRIKLDALPAGASTGTVTLGEMAEGAPAPRAVPQGSSAPPPAADPANRDLAPAEVAAEDRADPEGGENLLDTRRQTE